MSKLRLGPLPKSEPVRLSIVLSAQVKADLDRYAELYGETYGEAIDASALAAHMIAAFMERDREFKKLRRAAGSVVKRGLSLPTKTATPSDNETTLKGSLPDR